MYSLDGSLMTNWKSRPSCGDVSKEKDIILANEYVLKASFNLHFEHSCIEFYFWESFWSEKI